MNCRYRSKNYVNPILFQKMMYFIWVIKLQQYRLLELGNRLHIY